MNTYMDYSTPQTIIESGKNARKLGIKKSHCPISPRTVVNSIGWWDDGWDAQNKITCKGRNCTAVNGVGHSVECHDDHEAIYIKIRK